MKNWMKDKALNNNPLKGEDIIPNIVISILKTANRKVLCSSVVMTVMKLDIPTWGKKT